MKKNTVIKVLILFSIFMTSFTKGNTCSHTHLNTCMSITENSKHCHTDNINQIKNDVICDFVCSATFIHFNTTPLNNPSTFSAIISYKYILQDIHIFDFFKPPIYFS